jgi:two-component system, OmpR family, sensor kinase
MSLRLRLTLLYTGVLSGVVLLLSIVIYSMVSVVMINQVDNRLQQSADHIINVLRADTIGGVDTDAGRLNISNDIFYQVWSNENQLILYSDNSRDFTGAIDEDAKEMGQPVFREVTLDDVALRVLTVPLVVNERSAGWLQVAIALTDLRYTQQILQLVFTASALFSIFIAGFVGWLITGQALEPLETMTRVATQITSTDDLSQRLPVRTSRNDEVSEMVLAFNQTLVRLERLFSAQKRFLADVSHELRTPLTVIKGNVGLMRIMKAFDEESLVSIESEVDRLTRLVGDLLFLAQAETGKLPLMKGLVALDDLVFEVFEQMKVLSGGKHDIRLVNIAPTQVVGDRDRLKQVLLNLGSNAIKYTPEGYQIDLGLYPKGNWVKIVVKDQGPGISKKDLEHLFERFFRGDKSRSRSEKEGGFGLGLSIAYWIVKNHDGRIDVDSEVGVGTTFAVWLPISQAEIPTQPLRPTRLKE